MLHNILGAYAYSLSLLSAMFSVLCKKKTVIMEKLPNCVGNTKQCAIDMDKDIN